MSAGRFAIGVDIGGTTTKVAVVGSSGDVRHLATMPTASESGDALLQRLCGLILEARHRAQSEGLALNGLGVAVAGFINGAHDRLAYNPNIPWLTGYPLRDSISRNIDLPVILECDSNSAALAEYTFGAGSGAARFLCIACGTGVGGGMIVDGQILRYSWECLGDIGHIIVQPEGARCACGGRGCLEALISAEAVTANWCGATGQTAAKSLRDVIVAAREGDRLARGALAQAGRLLGFGLASLTNILSPDRIAVAGGLSEAGDFLLPAAKETFQASASTMFRDHATVCKATLGAHATLVGAACPVLEQPVTPRISASAAPRNRVSPGES